MTDTITPLSPRHERFVLEFLRDGDATQAYIRAGYAPRGAQPSASKLLRDPRIEAAIAAGRLRIAQSLAVDVDRLAQEYAKIAFANVGDFVSVEADGRLRVDLDKASRAQQAGILELKVSNHRKPEQQQVTLKLGKPQALAVLVKQIGVLVAKPAPGLTAEDRQRFEERCGRYERLLDHGNQEQQRLEKELREARAALAATQAGPANQDEAPRAAAPEEPQQAAAAEQPQQRPAVEPGMPTTAPETYVPRHLQGRIFWNTDRRPPPGPTWNEIIARAGPGGFPGR